MSPEAARNTAVAGLPPTSRTCHGRCGLKRTQRIDRRRALRTGRTFLQRCFECISGDGPSQGGACAAPRRSGAWDRWVDDWQPANRGLLRARGREAPEEDPSLCEPSPEARYSGPENQLYRVEVHTGGEASSATFKWSRDNASVTYPVRRIDGQAVTLEHLGLDARLGLQVGDWVEIEDEKRVLRGRTGPLLRVEEIDHVDMRVRLSGTPSSEVEHDTAKYRLLRRWDHGAGGRKRGELHRDTGTLLIEEDTWIELEDGVQVYFSSTAPYTVLSEAGENLPDVATKFRTTPEELRRLNKLPAGSDVLSGGQTLEVPVNHRYREHDYWLIPARTITGDVEWPKDAGEPEAQAPHGVEHHYAPLAIVRTGGKAPVDCRYQFRPLRDRVQP